MNRHTKRWLAVPVIVALGSAPAVLAQATSQAEQQRQQQQRQQQQQDAQRQQAQGAQADKADKADKAGQAGQQQGEHLAQVRQMIGKEVRTQDDKTIGHVQNVLLDLSNNRAAYVAIHLAGTDVQQVRDRVAIVPFGAVSKSDDRGVTLKTPASKLDEQHTFEANQIPDLSSTQLAQRLHQHFQVEPYWQQFGAQQQGQAGQDAQQQAMRQQQEQERQRQQQAQAGGQTGQAGQDAQQQAARQQQEQERQRQQQAQASGQAGQADPHAHQQTASQQPVRPVFIAQAKLLMDCNVTDDQGQTLGQLKDVVIDAREGRLVYGIVSLTEGQQAQGGEQARQQQEQEKQRQQQQQARAQQGQQGQQDATAEAKALPALTGRLAIVPWSALSLQPLQNQLSLQTGDRQTLERLSFDAQQFPTLGNAQYATQIHRAFNQEPYWQVFGYGADGEAIDAQQQQRMQEMRRQQGQQGAAAQQGAAQQGQGWEQYNQQYDAQRAQTIEGTITEVSAFAPSPQAAPGLAVTVQTAEGQTRIIHLAPLSVMRQQDLQLGQGDRVRVSGSQAQIQGQTVLIARQVQKGDQALLLRNEQGQPLWRQGEQQQERQQQQR